MKRHRFQNDFPDKKVSDEEVEELLDGITKKELTEFLKEYIVENPDLLNQLRAHFSDLGSDGDIAAQIRAILNGAGDRHGYIDYHAAFEAGRRLSLISDQARKLLQDGRLRNSFVMASALVKVLTPALDEVDDSRGSIGEPIREAMEVLYALTIIKLPEELRQEIFQYAANTYKSRVFAGWDWHQDHLELALNLASGEHELQLVDTFLRKHPKNEFEGEQLLMLRAKWIGKTKGEKQALAFKAENLRCTAFRKDIIKYHQSQKDYEKAISLATEGIAQDKPKRPGLVYTWYQLLLDIYLEIKNKEKIISYARILYVSRFSRDPAYYDLLKKHVPNDEWPEFVEKLIFDLSDKGRYMYEHEIGKIYSKEANWPKLMEWLKIAGSTFSLSEYAKIFPEEYKQELVILYTNLLKKEFAESKTRAQYKMRCSSIKQLAKMGGLKQAKELIAELRIAHNNRPAMLQELDYASRNYLNHN